MKRCYWLLALWLGSMSVVAAPLLDMVDVQGIRENQLVGYGLVVGLSGTGDKSQTKFTSQSIKNMLSQFGVQLPANADPKLKNVAAVAVSATLPPLAAKGQALDITVSSMGDAKSLRGGTLLLTPLRGVDGQVYAMAQGNLVVGGLNAEGASGSGITVNIPTAGLIPNGALIEREIPSSFLTNPDIVLNLKQPGFNTARNIEMAINRVLGPGVANAQSNAKVVMRAPLDPSQRVSFMAALENLKVAEGPTPARIIFNARTGTIVMGQNVRVRPAVVSHGSLTVNIVENSRVSQPNPLSNGQTVVTPQSNVSVNEERGKAFVWPAGTSLKTIVDAINSLGATPSDLMSILQALKQAGALEGELIVI
ncbi:flagellar basal body P-ring protein FlgI [Plesiomonas shigelloides]|uniref:flagellar basal body P-ring protein FlgI n=1 Tax=Plesiomonas shigelloides TaxID=703 RepID=UPI002886B265|nr:flagellar basal body P-ring protein FlgI [Plesiomonas shigelloides]MDT1011802.1 flagellar basal body P-ring protein FlgI [Plesiomonas shigelloides]